MYTFTNWITTPENRSAEAAARQAADAVSSSPGPGKPSLVFLHGPSGSGKTHLTAAISAVVTARCPDRTVTLVQANDLAHPQDDASPDWRADLLIVEDVQHLADRAADLLAAVLDTRSARGQVTVCTAVAGPARLTHLPARLVSRLAGGLVVGLEPLGPDSRRQFLRELARRRKVSVPPDVLDWLADHLGGSGRQLEGAIHRLETLVRLQPWPLDRDTLATHFAAEADGTRPTVERIAERVGRYFQVEARQLQSRRRHRHALLPRQVGMYLARQLTPLSLEQIGSYFGGRDHSTVLHACRKVERALQADAALCGAVRQIRADLA